MENAALHSTNATHRLAAANTFLQFMLARESLAPLVGVVGVEDDREVLFSSSPSSSSSDAHSLPLSLALSSTVCGTTLYCGLPFFILVLSLSIACWSIAPCWSSSLCRNINLFWWSGLHILFGKTMHKRKLAWNVTFAVYRILLIF